MLRLNKHYVCDLVANDSLEVYTSFMACNACSLLADDYPLHKLAYEGDARQITAHLKLGYSANKRDPYSWLPIHYAAWLVIFYTLLKQHQFMINLDKDRNKLVTVTSKWQAMLSEIVNVLYLLNNCMGIKCDNDLLCSD